MSNSAQTPQQPTVSLPNQSDDPVYLPFRQEVFSSFTPLQIRILIAAREVALRGNGVQKEIAHLANTSASYVTRALAVGVDRHDLPVVYTLARECIGDKVYSDLTALQQQIINYRIVRPDATFQSIADRLNCSRIHVLYTCRQYSDIIEEQMPGDSVPPTSSEANDIPLNDLTTNYRNQEEPAQTVSVDPDSPLLTPFTAGLLESLPGPYRHILLAGREWALRGDPSYTPITDVVNIGLDHVRHVIQGFRHYDDHYPTAASIAEEFAPNHSYDSLTDTQREIVNMIAIDPTTSNTDISEQCDASTTYVSYTRTRCRGIIHTRRKAAGAPPVDPTIAFRLHN